MVSYCCVFPNVFSNAYSMRMLLNTYCKNMVSDHGVFSIDSSNFHHLRNTFDIDCKDMNSCLCVYSNIFFIILILLESLYTLNASIWILACVYSQMIFKSSSYEKAFWHWWHWNRDTFLPNCIFFATNTLCLLDSNINTLCLHLLARLLKLSTSYSNVNNGTNAT